MYDSYAFIAMYIHIFLSNMLCSIYILEYDNDIYYMYNMYR